MQWLGYVAIAAKQVLQAAFHKHIFMPAYAGRKPGAGPRAKARLRRQPFPLEQSAPPQSVWFTGRRSCQPAQGILRCAASGSRPHTLPHNRRRHGGPGLLSCHTTAAGMGDPACYPATHTGLAGQYPGLPQASLHSS